MICGQFPSFAMTLASALSSSSACFSFSRSSTGSLLNESHRSCRVLPYRASFTPGWCPADAGHPRTPSAKQRGVGDVRPQFGRSGIVPAGTPNHVHAAADPTATAGTPSPRPRSPPPPASARPPPGLVQIRPSRLCDGWDEACSLCREPGMAIRQEPARPPRNAR